MALPRSIAIRANPAVHFMSVPPWRFSASRRWLRHNEVIRPAFALRASARRAGIGQEKSALGGLRLHHFFYFDAQRLARRVAAVEHVDAGEDHEVYAIWRGVRRRRGKLV